MKLTIEPMHKEYSHQVTSRRTWGYQPYIAGNLRIRNPKNQNRIGSPYEYNRSLRGLLFSLFLLAMIIISRETVANEQPLSGEMHFIAKDGQKYPAIHLKNAASFSIKGLHTQVQLTQSFTNNTKQWVEGIYAFPLPPDSSVYAMKMVIGERVIKAEIRERKEAKKIYSQAKKSGKKAALIEQERPNIFTQSVANIGPGESIMITLEYLQPVRYDMGKFSIRFPMTITKRFSPRAVIPGSASNAKDILEFDKFETTMQGWATTEIVDNNRIPSPETIKPNTISLSIHLNAGMDLAQVESPSHPLEVKINTDNTYHISPIENEIVMDKDFELVWYPLQSNTPKAAVFHEQMDGESYVQLMLVPPYIEKKIPTPLNANKGVESALPRELILIVDTSGSMQGQSIIQAKNSVTLALKRLQTTDIFNIIEFNSFHHSLFKQPQPANTKNIEKALAFINKLQANGGTNMAPALHSALGTQSNEELLKQVVFITDGAVSNEQALFKLIHEQLHNSRLFTVGIGSAPNSHFMEKAAQFGRGTFTHISTTEQVNERMSELFRKLESPVMAGIEIHWPQGWAMESYPLRIPDLYLGEPLLITAKAPLQMRGQEQVVVNGKIIGKSWKRELSLPLPKTVYTQGISSDDTRAIIPSYWARFKIDHLLDQKTLGKDLQAIRNEVLPLALKYQLMSPYTSFIAVEEVLSRPEQAELAIDSVVNTKPEGQTTKHISYPKTATSAPVNILMGFMALLLAAFISQINKSLRNPLMPLDKVKNNSLPIR